MAPAARSTPLVPTHPWRCPVCGGRSRVARTDAQDDGSVHRRRECVVCQRRWTTIEALTKPVSVQLPLPPREVA